MKGARPATTTTMRLGPQPGEVIDGSQPFTFRWNGAAVPAYAGDTIISALAAAGERIVSRSFKYHRPRGILTASFLDPGCLVQVGDEPNVRGAHRRAEPGMVVRAQNVWPSLRYDVRAINQAMGRMLPPGFYYKTFMAPRALWPVYQQMLRRFSPGGVVSAARREAAFDQRYAHRDVLVAGGGRPGWRRRLRRRSGGRRCCWWRRSTTWADISAGVVRRNGRRCAICATRWRPTIGSRRSPTRW